MISRLSWIGEFIFSLRRKPISNKSKRLNLELLEDRIQPAPVALNDGPFNGLVGQVLYGPSVLANDTGSNLTAVGGIGPTANGNYMVLNSDGTFAVSPGSNFSGPDSFTYKAFDGTDYSDEATVLLYFAPPTENHAFHWTGAGNDGLWDNPANWDQNSVPSINDDADLGSGVDAVTDPGMAEVRSITGSRPLVIGGSMTVASSLDTDGLVTVNGDLTILGTANVQNLDLTGGNLKGPGVVTVTNLMNWQSGNLAVDPGTLEIASVGVLNISSSSTKQINGWTVNVYGTVNWTQGDVDNADSAVNVNDGGVFNASSNGTWQDANDKGLSSINIHESGTLNAAAGEGEATTVEAVFNANGNVNAQAGTLYLKGGGTFVGTTDIWQNCEIALTARVFSASNGALFTSTQQGGLLGRFRIRTEYRVTGTVVQDAHVILSDGGTITGPGVLLINRRFSWIGGRMNDANGTTQIASTATMVVDYSDMIDQLIDPSLLADRNLQNNGVITITGNTSAVTFSIGANLINDGQFVLSTLPNGGVVDVRVILGGDVDGSLINDSRIIVRGGGSGRIVYLAGNDLEEMAPNNGSIEVEAGVLNLSGGFRNYGYLETASQGIVNFADGTFVFDPERNDTSSDMMRGTGSFNVVGATVLVPQTCVVNASNFQLQSGTLRGTGEFVAQFFTWSGGTMSEGITTINTNARMDISNDVIMNDRIIRAFGRINWQYAELIQTIAMQNSSQIQIDGGRFETFNVNGEITTDAQTDNRILLTNSGVFVRNITEVPGAISIAARLQNNGGTAEFQGDTTLLRYSQSGASSSSLFGSGLYTFVEPQSLVVDGGTITLNGGTINNQQAGVTLISNASIEGFGTINIFDISNCTVNLTGTLYTGRFDIYNNSLVNLHGFTLWITNGWSKNSGSMIFGQGGVARIGNVFVPLND